MNFFDGEIVAIDADGVLVRLRNDAEIRAAIDDAGIAAGAQVALGIRPEHALIQSGSGAIDAVVDLTEQLGGHCLVYVGTPHTDDVAVIQAPSDFAGRRGEAVSIGLPPDKCHVFDAAGLALRRLPQASLAAVRA